MNDLERTAIEKAWQITPLNDGDVFDFFIKFLKNYSMIKKDLIKY